MKQYIVLVAGYDYQNSGVDFSRMADRRKNYLLKQNPSWASDSEMDFIRLDAKTGKIERNNSSNRGDWIMESTPFIPISRRTHYQQNTFIQQDTQVLSITDCYRYIANIGASEPGTVKEFSILGHGWFDGPILVNSYQRNDFRFDGAHSLDRDPWDKDGRAKDFFANNLDVTTWTNFRNAFASDGFCWVWGCLFPRAFYNILYSITRSRTYTSKTLGMHTDSDSFEISVSSAFANEHYPTDMIFFPSSTTERNFTRTLGDLKAFLKRGILRCYPGRFVLDNGINCRAAFLGVYSDYERARGNIRSTETVMVIPRNRETYGIDFSNIINFYKHYLLLNEDPSGKGYAVYDNGNIRQFWNDLQT